MTSRLELAVVVLLLLASTVALFDTGARWRQEPSGAWVRDSIFGQQRTACWHWIHLPNLERRWAIARTPLFDGRVDQCLEWRHP